MNLTSAGTIFSFHVPIKSIEKSVMKCGVGERSRWVTWLHPLFRTEWRMESVRPAGGISNATNLVRFYFHDLRCFQFREILGSQFCDLPGSQFCDLLGSQF